QRNPGPVPRQCRSRVSLRSTRATACSYFSRPRYPRSGFLAMPPSSRGDYAAARLLLLLRTRTETIAANETDGATVFGLQPGLPHRPTAEPLAPGRQLIPS